MTHTLLFVNKALFSIISGHFKYMCLSNSFSTISSTQIIVLWLMFMFWCSLLILWTSSSLFLDSGLLGYVRWRLKCSAISAVKEYPLDNKRVFSSYLLLLYYSFQKHSAAEDIASSLSEDQVPKPFLIMVLIQFGTMVVDRALYLRKTVMGKVIFQVILVFGIHFWMFFILPAVTER